VKKVYKIEQYANVSYDTDRHGKHRARYRKMRYGRMFRHRFTYPVGSVEFHREYELCRQGIKPGLIEIPVALGNTMSDLIERYYRSPRFLALKPSSVKDYRSIIEEFRGDYGKYKVTDFKASLISRILADKVDTPTRANKLLKRLKQLFKLAIFMEMRETDPTVGVDYFKIKSSGFYSWTDVDILRFEERHPIGTQARLAFAIMLYIGARRSDLVRLGWQHIEDGRICFTQEKTREPVKIKIHPALQRVLDATPRDNMIFIVTAYGRAFSKDGFGNRMRKWCDAAGLPQCTSHGLRKAKGRRMAEAGLSQEEITAGLGQRSVKESEVYTRAANKVLLADKSVKF